MNPIVIFLIGFVVGILVGRKHTGAVESVVSFVKGIIGKK